MINMNQRYININDFNKTEIKAIIHFMDTGEISPIIKPLVSILMNMSTADFTILYYTLESTLKRMN